MTRDMANEIAELNESAQLLDGHDNAIVGMSGHCGMSPVVLYDPLKIIDNLMRNSDMTHEDAVEFYSYNIEGAYVGKHSPVYLIRLESMVNLNEPSVDKDKS